MRHMMSDLRDMIATFLYTLEWGDDPSLDSVDIAPFLTDADKLLAGLKGTPLPRILDALDIEYRTGGMRDFGDGTFEVDEIESNGLPLDLDRNRVPVLVVDNPATDEARDG